MTIATKTLGAQRWKLCVAGVLIAGTISLGLAMVRGLWGSDLPTWEGLVADVVEESVTYIYVAGSTLMVALVLGWLIGGRAEHLERMSLTDPLTQLANRRGLMAVLNDELQRATRYHTPLTLMILDLDHLKDINDGGGHEAGDAALRLVADSLRGTCRSSDLAARLGGDEFVVVAPSTSALEAQELASRIRNKLVGLSEEHPELGQLSVSAGIADLTCTGSQQAEALIGAADGALYCAKEAGRDRAVVARSLPSAPRSMAVA